MTTPDQQGARPPRLLTAKEVALELNVSLRTVRRLITEQKIAVVRIGRVVRITPEALVALIGKQ
jgi:excisionase family DNA binding protein